EADCLQDAAGRFPEVSAELLNALVAFQRTLAVPQAPAPSKNGARGYGLFVSLGCASCHWPQLPVELPGQVAADVPAVIAPYTGLTLHNLGAEMTDRSVSGARVVSKWRTAPLWGLGYRMTLQHPLTLLHDGRARSPEEAILWHFGEASHARNQFV